MNASSSLVPADTLSNTQNFSTGADALVLKGTLDALSTHIAILDEKGFILAVNAAWRRFAQNNGFQGTGAGLGANYLDVCIRATGQNSEEAPLVLDGIRAVLQGKKDEFYLEYPCHGPQEARWFALRATRFWTENSDEVPLRVVVSHESITARKLAEIQLREESNTLHTLYRVSQIVAGELQLPRIVEAVTQAAVELSHAQVGAFIPNADQAQFANLAVYSQFQGKNVAHKLAHKVPTVLSERFWQNRHLVRLNNTHERLTSGINRGRWPFVDAQPSDYPNLVSCLVAPVMSRSGQHLGAFVLGHEAPGRFTQSDEDLLALCEAPGRFTQSE